MKLVQISDIHLTCPGERMGGLDPHKRFAQALADVRAHHADAARIVITGDLTHWGEPAAYRMLQDAISDAPAPVRLLIGNHDDRSCFLDAFPDHPRDPNGYVNYAETIDGHRLIYLDSTAPQTHAGHFGSDRIDWLEAELETASRARIFLHHNPMKLGLPAADKISLVAEDRVSFQELLSRYASKIDYIHFGHVHAPIHGTFCGIPFASVPSTGNQSLPNMVEPDLLLGAPMPPSYYVISVSGTGTIIHEVPFTWDGPVFAAGTNWDDWAKPVAAE